MIDLTTNVATRREGGCPMKQLTSEQIAGFSLEFLLAGYETTANALSYITHLLAIHPDVQEKLQAEIDQYFEEAQVKSLAAMCHGNVVGKETETFLQNVATFPWQSAANGYILLVYRRLLCMMPQQSSAILTWSYKKH